jgi:hypothetical protein
MQSGPLTPSDFSPDARGNVWITDLSNNRVVEYSQPNTQAPVLATFFVQLSGLFVALLEAI